MRRVGWRGTLLGLLWLTCACGGHSTTNTDGVAGSGGATTAGAAGSGDAASAGHPVGAGAGGTSTGGSGSGAAAAPGVLQDFLGDPRFPDSFWQPATDPSGVDLERLEQAVRLIESSGWEIHSFLIAKNDRLVFERYGWSSGENPADPNKQPHQVLPNERHLQFSVTKSVLSTLVGLALVDGAFSDLKVRAADFFSDYASLNPTPEKSSITLEDLLTMRSGLEFEEGEQSTFGAPDPARAMLARPVVDLPVGTIWNYSSGGADVIAEMLRVATGKKLLEYANEKLFGPIGIDSPPWDSGRSGNNFGGVGLSLTSREMARFGALIRNGGRWNNQGLLPLRAWVNESTLARCATEWGGQYGYLWWVPDLPGFFNAFGSFGQMIYVSRSRGLVIVFTAYLPNDVAKTHLEGLVRDYVLPATE